MMEKKQRRSICELLGCLMLVAAVGCGSDAPVEEEEPDEVTPESWEIERLFPSAENEGVEFNGCIYGSPFLYEGGESTSLITLDAEGELAALDPDTGAERWSMTLPAPEGEAPLALSQPARIDDHRIVVAYHTVPGGKDEIDANTTRLSHRVTVVDLAEGQVAEDFGTITLEAELPANEDGSTVAFRPGHALSRPDIELGRAEGDQFGKAYVTMGNTRDIQPWHGWAVEIDLDAWHT